MHRSFSFRVLIRRVSVFGDPDQLDEKFIATELIRFHVYRAVRMELFVFVRLVTERSSPTSGTSRLPPPARCRRRPAASVPHLVNASTTRTRSFSRRLGRGYPMTGSSSSHVIEWSTQPTACMSGAVVRRNGFTSRLASASAPQDPRGSRDEGDLEKSVSTVADGLHLS